MTEEIVKKEIPKMISVDVNEASWSDGYYNSADKNCAAYSKSQSDLYLGHTMTYWVDLGISWIPLLVIVVIWCFLAKKGKYANHLNRVEEINEKIYKNNELAYEETMKTNVLLQQLVEKLDKK